MTTPAYELVSYLSRIQPNTEGLEMPVLLAGGLVTEPSRVLAILVHKAGQSESTRLV